MTDQVYIAVKQLKTNKVASSIMGPMSDHRADHATMGLLMNMGPEFYVDEWPASEGESGGNQPTAVEV